MSESRGPGEFNTLLCFVFNSLFRKSTFFKKLKFRNNSLMKGLKINHRSATVSDN